MINYIIPLISKVLPIFGYVLNYVFALAFLATVPVIIRDIVRR